MRVQHLPPAADSRGTRIALMFALVAEHLAQHYNAGQWLSQAQCVSLVASWLERSQRQLALAERRRLADLSAALAQQMVDSLSHEAGLHVSHELMEALDPNYHSELAQAVMAQCDALLED